MSSKTRTQDSADNGAPIPLAPYPLDLVSQLAVQLLKGENYSEAVKRTIALLDECASELERRKLRSAQERLADASPPRPSDMGWDDFVKYLTDGERRTRAEPKLNDFFKFDVKRGKAVELAKPWVGTTRTAERMWSQFIDRVPETTPAELSDRLRELNSPRQNLLTGKELPAIIAGGLAEIYKGRYLEWQHYEKMKKASSAGKQGGRGRKKEKDT